MAKKPKLIESLKKETEKDNFNNPVLDEPSILIYKDGKFHEEVATSQFRQWLASSTKIKYRDVEGIIDRYCHINGWSFKRKK